MADFKTHISASTFIGLGYGTVGHVFFQVPLPTAILAGGLCSVSGMLPDVDSDSGTPLRESLAFGAAVVSMMVTDRLMQLGLGSETIVLIGAALYLFVRFVFGEVLRRYTVHRGMFHSLPAALIFGELAFLLASGPMNLRLYKAAGVLVGYVTHLVLDELYSIHWKQGRVRLKRSFGTALKIVGRGWWPNVSTYGKLILLTYIIFYEPAWFAQIQQRDLVNQLSSWAAEQSRILSGEGQQEEKVNPESLLGAKTMLDSSSEAFDGEQFLARQPAPEATGSHSAAGDWLAPVDVATRHGSESPY